MILLVGFLEHIRSVKIVNVEFLLTHELGILFLALCIYSMSVFCQALF